MSDVISMGEFIRQVQEELIKAAEAKPQPPCDVAEVVLEMTIVRQDGRVVVVTSPDQAEALTPHKATVKLQPPSRKAPRREDPKSPGPRPLQRFGGPQGGSFGGPPGGPFGSPGSGPFAGGGGNPFVPPGEGP